MIIRNIFLLLAGIIFALPANGLELDFKSLLLHLPDDGIEKISMVDLPGSPIMVEGEAWNFYISDQDFDKDCASIKLREPSVSCAHTDRLALLKRAAANEGRLQTLVFGTYRRPDGVIVEESGRYLFFLGLAKGVSTVIVVNKKTGKTFQIRGQFDRDTIMKILAPTQ